MEYHGTGVCVCVWRVGRVVRVECRILREDADVLSLSDGEQRC